jgi:hypothetical protein
VALLAPTVEFQCQELAKAVQDEETNFDVLFDVLLSASSQEIEDIKTTYQRLYNKSLESQIHGEFKGFLLSNKRDEPGKIDEIVAEIDAQRLFKSGVHTFINKGSVFEELFTQKCFEQLKLVCEHYKTIAGDTLENQIFDGIDDDVGDVLVTIVKWINGIPEFVARRLFMCMNGIGTNNSQLIRLIVIHCEKDMVGIKVAFESIYNQTLGKFIQVGTCDSLRLS